jgi:hypothetical protein
MSNCPHIVSCKEGAHYCDLAESSVRGRDEIIATLTAQLAVMREALEHARTQLILLGGNPALFTAHNGDSVQAAVVEIVDAALAEAPPP